MSKKIINMTTKHPMQQIIRNAVQCPDGVVLDSLHRHDYQSHVDTLTGEVYFTDGGLEYIRRSINNTPAKDLTVMLSDGHSVVRDVFTWGSRSEASLGSFIDSNGSIKRRKLSELSDLHIGNIIRTQKHIQNTYVMQLMIDELEHREINGITIKEYK